MKILIVAGLLLVLGCGTADEGSGVLDDNPPAPGTEYVEIDAKLPHFSNTKIDVLGCAVKLRPFPSCRSSRLGGKETVSFGG